MDSLKSIFELREMLRQMERDIGLDGLSHSERDVLLAAHSLAPTPEAVVESDEIRGHNLVKSLAQATYHRALRRLLDLGYLEHARGSKAKLYTVRSDLLGR